MGAYVKLSKKEYDAIKSEWSNVDAWFWHAVDDNWNPRGRIHNNYRRAAVYRHNDTLYFLCRAAYVIPESEYKFIEGNVDVDLTHSDGPTRSRYYEFKKQQPACDFDASISGVTMFEHRINIEECVSKPTPRPVTATKIAPKPTKPVARKAAPKRGVAKVAKKPVAVNRDEPKKPSAPKVVREPIDEVNPLEGVVNRRPKDRSGWAGTRKRRSCVTRKDAWDSAEGCRAIGAMFSR